MDLAFDGDRFGREIVLLYEHPVFEALAVARIPVRDSRSGIDGNAVRIDYGYGMHITNPKAQRCMGRIDNGFSLLRLDLQGSERDTTALGVFIRASLLVWLSRHLEFGLHGSLHGWIGGDDHGVQAAGATAIGLGLGCSW